ncbi:MAG: glycosyltransferase family 4 protein [Chthoniobacter sp.]|uniref:glycosyltransferase family 4 protein n=1 Tax=Chthoniobacter sp. TaxID=2510640 RepID=UPI0032A34282
MNRFKVAILTTDKRESDRDYANPVPCFGTAPEALLQGFAQWPDAEIHVVSCAQQPLAAPEKIAPNIFFHSLLVPKLGWLRTGYQGCVRAARRKLREIQPDIVHGQGTERDCALSAVLSGFQNVLTVHGNMRLIARVNRARPFSFNWLAARLESFTLPRADGIVCITRYTEAAVRHEARRTWVVPNAVDPSFFEVASQPDEVPVILCVGYISPRKNQNDFIRALDGAAGGRRFRIVFLGHVPDDLYGSEFRALLATRPWCEAAGFADRGALKTWLARATALALPSLEDNCPMAVLEAMAANVPVMAANVGGVPDLVADGVTGVLCDPLNGGSMVRAFTALLDSSALRDTVARNARQQAEVRFQPKAVAGRHLEIYREVLSKRA